MHLRYLTPTNSSTANGLRKHPIPNPIVFWACTADAGTQFTNSPFDRRNLGYDTLFGEKTMFYHVNPAAAANDGRSSAGNVKDGGDSLVIWIDVPVLDLNRTSAGVVEWGTVAIIVLGSVWVCWALGRVLMRDSKGKGKGNKSAVEKKVEWFLLFELDCISYLVVMEFGVASSRFAIAEVAEQCMHFLFLV
jgi:hypothetical protein